MYVQIGGRRESDFTEPLGLLSDCHRRIERFLGALLAVARQGTLDRPVVEAALRYFREAAPNHTRDEEESLFPRLRSSSDPRAEEALARVEALEADHREAEEAHRQVESLFGRWLAGGDCPAGLVEVLERLSAIYAAHIAVEDGEVFPLAAEVLADEDLAVVGREMAARRGL